MASSVRKTSCTTILYCYLKEQAGANLLTSDYLLYPARKWCCLVTKRENIFCVSVINTVEVLENKKLLYGAPKVS